MSGTVDAGAGAGEDTGPDTARTAGATGARGRPAVDVLLQQNRSLRAWAAGLRAWSESTRQTVQAQRVHNARLRSTRVDKVSPAARATVEVAARFPRDDRFPRMGPVGTSEMVAILVDSHGIGPAAAARSVLEGLRLAGYPEDDTDVSAADAFDIIERAVGRLYP